MGVKINRGKKEEKEGKKGDRQRDQKVKMEKKIVGEKGSERER